MSESTLDERIGTVSHDEAEQLALAYIDRAFGKPEKEGRRIRHSIPANPREDTDLRLMGYIRQQRRKEFASTREPTASDREALDLELEADRFLGRYGEPSPEWQRKDLVALLSKVALASASPDRYPDRPAEAASPPASDADRCERTVHSFRGMVRCLLAKGHPGFHSYDEPPAAEVAAPTGEPTVILRCKRRKVPGDGGVVDGCGWQGPAPRVSCPSCGSLLLRPLPAAPKGTP